MERFERKGLELPFKELAQLKQVGTPEDFDVSMARLVLLFTKGLIEPLRGLVKSHKPATLKDAMNLTRDLQNMFSSNKYPP